MTELENKRDRLKFRHLWKQLPQQLKEEQWENATSTALAALSMLPQPVLGWKATGKLYLGMAEAQLKRGLPEEARSSAELGLRAASVSVREGLFIVCSSLDALCLKHEAAAAQLELFLAGGARVWEDRGKSATLPPVPDTPPPGGGQWGDYQVPDEWLSAIFEGLDPLGELEFDPKWRDGKTSIHCAAERVDGYTLRHLLEDGADPNAVFGPPDDLQWPLNLVVGRDRLDLAKLLLKKGAALEVCGVSIVPFVCSVPMLRLLLDEGAAIDGKNAGGVTALRLAVSLAQVEHSEALLDWGANPLEKGPDGTTPFDIVQERAVRPGNTQDAYQQLLVRFRHELEQRGLAK